MSYNSKYHISPLTEENLSKINESTATIKYDALLKYYTSGNEAPTHHHLRIETQNNRQTHQRLSPSEPPSSARRASKDVVMESPRLLPFPYHNDSHFLPTAERKQHKRMNGSFTDLSIRSQRTCITAPPMSPLTLSPLSSPTATITTLSFLPKRAASAPPNYIPRSSVTRKMASAERETSEASTSSFTSSRASSLPFYKLDTVLSRFLDLFKRKKKPSASSKPSTNARLAKKTPVWFTEFSVNPPPPTGMAMAAA